MSCVEHATAALLLALATAETTAVVRALSLASVNQLLPLRTYGFATVPRSSEHDDTHNAPPLYVNCGLRMSLW